MKKIIMVLCLVTLAACHSSGSHTNSTDSTSINTKTNSPADGGPNNGLPDSTSYNRMNDTMSRDSALRK